MTLQFVLGLDKASRFPYSFRDKENQKERRDGPDLTLKRERECV